MHTLKCLHIYIQVISVNFHPFFRNEKEPVKKDIFYTNYVSVNCPENIYIHSTDIINVVSVKNLYLCLCV